MKSTQKTLNVHGQHKNFAFGTQRKKIALGTQCNLYSTDSRWGFALGDTKNLRHPTQKIPSQRQRQYPTNGFAAQWNIGCTVGIIVLQGRLLGITNIMFGLLHINCQLMRVNMMQTVHNVITSFNWVFMCTVQHCVISIIMHVFVYVCVCARACVHVYIRL